MVRLGRGCVKGWRPCDFADVAGVLLGDVGVREEARVPGLGLGPLGARGGWMGARRVEGRAAGGYARLPRGHRWNSPGSPRPVTPIPLVPLASLALKVLTRAGTLFVIMTWVSLERHPCHDHEPRGVRAGSKGSWAASGRRRGDEPARPGGERRGHAS